MNLAVRFAGLALTLATTLFTTLLAQAQDWHRGHPHTDLKAPKRDN